MFRLLVIVTNLSLFALRTAADGDENNYFVNPPWVAGPLDMYDNNNVYGLRSKLNVNWETNYSTISLVLWQMDNASYVYLIREQPASKSFMWDVDLNGQYNISSPTLDLPNVFSLELWEIIGNDGQIGGRFSCHHFNVTGDQSKAAGSSDTLATASATDSPAGPTNSSSSLTNTTDEVSSSAKASSTPGLSSDAKIAIGIGVGVGAACLIIGAVASLFFWRKSRNALAARDQSPQPEMQNREEKEHPRHLNERNAKAGPSPAAQAGELSADDETHELASAQSHELPGGRTL